MVVRVIVTVEKCECMSLGRCSSYDTFRRGLIALRSDAVTNHRDAMLKAAKQRTKQSLALLRVGKALQRVLFAKAKMLCHQKDLLVPCNSSQRLNCDIHVFLVS